MTATVPVLASREAAGGRDYVIGAIAKATSAAPRVDLFAPPGDQVGTPFQLASRGGYAVADAPGSESIPAQIISILLTLTYTIDCRASPGLPPGWLFLDGLTVRAGATPLRSARYSGSWALDAIIKYSDNDAEYFYSI